MSAGTVGAQTWIEVGDSGLAIPAEEREKIFTPFFRGNQGKRTTQGMGLGLSIARDLVAAHGGRLELENTTEDGNHFRIWLPSLV